MKLLGFINETPKNNTSESEFFICRRIKYGKNNNFVRYEPVNWITKRDAKEILKKIVLSFRS